MKLIVSLQSSLRVNNSILFFWKQEIKKISVHYFDFNLCQIDFLRELGQEP